MSNPFSEDPQERNPFESPQAPMGQPVYGAYSSRPRDNGLAVTSMILGIASLALIPVFCCCGPLALVNAVLAVTGGVLGWIAYSQAKRGEAGGEGMALTGMITSGVTLAIVGAGILYFVIMLLIEIVSSA